MINQKLSFGKDATKGLYSIMGDITKRHIMGGDLLFYLVAMKLMKGIKNVCIGPN